MKKNTLYILIVLLTITYTASRAQVPGFMGKRMLISLNASPCVILPIIGEEDKDVGIGKYRIRPRFGASFDYVINRRTTLGVHYSFVNIGNIQNSYSDDVISGIAPTAISIHSVGLRWTRYRSGNLPAPLGMFGGWQLGLGITPLIDKDGIMLDPYGEKKKGVYLTSVHPDVTVFYGVRRGIGKSLMWSLSGELNLAYTGYLISMMGDGKEASDIKGTSEDGKWAYIGNKELTRSAYYSSSLINITLEFTFLPK